MTATAQQMPAEPKAPTPQELLDKDQKSLDDVKAQIKLATDNMTDILRLHGHQESNIPLSSGYWAFRNQSLQLDETKRLLEQAVAEDQKAVDAATAKAKSETKQPVAKPAETASKEPEKK